MKTQNVNGILKFILPLLILIHFSACKVEITSSAGTSSETTSSGGSSGGSTTTVTRTGMTWNNSSSSSTGLPSKILELSDGSYLVAGTMSNGTDDDAMLAKFSENGTLDTTFGTSGIYLYDSGLGNDSASSVQEQSDGKLILAGSISNSADAFVLRLSSSGVLDATYATAGVYTYDSGNDDIINGMVIQTDGMILVTGGNNGGSSDIFIIRLTTAGIPDVNFDGPLGGANGVVVLDNGGDDIGYDVAVQADGKILVTGKTELGDVDLFIMRLNSADGSYDNDDGDGGFGMGGGMGMNLYDGGNGADIGIRIALQSDSKIIIAGFTQVAGAFEVEALIARYGTDGNLDTTFNGTGIMTLDIGWYDAATSVGIQSDGKIVVGGMSVDTTFAFYTAYTARITTAGVLDTTFDSDGIRTYIDGSSALVDQVYVMGLLVDSNDKCLAYHSYDNGGGDWDNALIRLTTSAGALDTTFGEEE